MKRTRRYAPTIATICVLIAGGVAIAPALRTPSHDLAKKEFIEKMSREAGLPDQVKAFRTLLSVVGVREAQMILSQALPNSFRTHTIDHESGKFLYKTRGMRGIEDCLPYLVGGCYHGFISELLATQGFESLAELVRECEAGLASEQETQCAHGVGHAFLEKVGYGNLPTALTQCASGFASNQRAVENCYNGVFMESSFDMLSRPAGDRFYKQTDPMYPCNEEFVNSKAGAHKKCWEKLSPRILDSHAFPQFEGMPTLAAQYCDTLAAKDDQVICHESIAHRIHSNTPGNVRAIIDTCKSLPDRHVPFCIAHGVAASYMYGDRSKETLSFCNSFSETDKPVCYHAFYEGIAISFSSSTIRVEACRTLPEESFQKKCIEWMSTPEGLSY